jgi:hypothetical protein
MPSNSVEFLSVTPKAVLHLFRMGCDTAEIAEGFNVPECEIYNLLALRLGEIAEGPGAVLWNEGQYADRS